MEHEFGKLTNKPLKKGKTMLLFDIDGTLTKPLHEIDDNMINLLTEINKNNPNINFAVVGGSDYKQIKSQIGKIFPILKFIFSENGGRTYDEKLNLINDKRIHEHFNEKQIQEMLNFALRYIARLELPVKRGTFIQYRTSTINISPIGRDCTLEERKIFIEYDKKNNILENFKLAFDNAFALKFNVSTDIGGQISFDVFPKGWDKRYCLQFLKDYDNIIFFGDKTYVGGSDYEIGISQQITQGYNVINPEETIEKIKNVLKEINEIEK